MLGDWSLILEKLQYEVFNQIGDGFYLILKGLINLFSLSVDLIIVIAKAIASLV